MESFDHHLLHLINREWTSPVLDWIMAVASSIDLWLPLLVIGGVIGFLVGSFRIRALIFCILVSIGLVDGVWVNHTKDLMNRPRPSQAVDYLRSVDLADTNPRFLALWQPPEAEVTHALIQPYDGRSFPSGHVANNFAVATVLALFFRAWGWLYYLPASLVGYSRIYVGAHWPSDVILSAIFSVGATLLIIMMAEWLWFRCTARLMPGVWGRHPSLIEP